jgi:hypothetical protein
MKYALKVKDKNVYYAVQRFPGFTSCSKEGRPGIYDVQTFDSREDAKKALSAIPEEQSIYNDQWEVIDWPEST